MFKKSIVLSSVAFLISGIVNAQGISTYPPGSPLYEAVKENLLRNGNKEISDEQIIKHINASTEIVEINNELSEYFSDRLLESSLDNSSAGVPRLKIYVKNLTSGDIRHIYSIKKYEMVQLENNRFNKNEVSEINKIIAETLIKKERLAKSVRSGYYEPETDNFVVKIAIDDTSEFREELKSIQNKHKINIKFLKDEADALTIQQQDTKAIKKNEDEALGYLKLGGVDVTGGLPISKGSGPNCTIGFSIINANGTNGFLTAGHCVNAGDSVRLFAQSSLSYVPIGVTGFSSNGWGNGNDYARVTMQPGVTYLPYVTRYGNSGKFNTYYDYAWGRYNKPIRIIVSPIKNNQMCKTGFPSGETCGTITNPSTWAQVSSSWGIPSIIYNIIETNACAIVGDSGGPAYDLNASGALGIVIAGSSAHGGVCKSGAVVGGGSNKTILVPIWTALTQLGVNLMLHTGPATYSENCSAPLCMK
ncbi:S1 family peptidase [Comamonas odontotermitis]|uniref:S1 family peptidase n=1 Tax=Comamonas odontotermitis TaxID=379895 RepID=UPI0037514B1F